MEDLENRAEFRIESVMVNNKQSVGGIFINSELRATNKQISIYYAESELTFEFPESDERFKITNARVPLSDINEINKNGTILITEVDLLPLELEKIEDFRKGGDFIIELITSIRGRYSRDDSIGAGTFSDTYHMRAGEWSEILDILNYHDHKSFQVKLSHHDTHIRDILTTASGKMERAERHHNNGDYESAVTASRRVIETLRTLAGDIEPLVDSHKWEKLESNMAQFEKGFVGALSHSEDKTNIQPTLKRDSDLILGLTKSYLRYVSSVLEEESK